MAHNQPYKPKNDPKPKDHTRKPNGEPWKYLILDTNGNPIPGLGTDNPAKAIQNNHDHPNTTIKQC